MPSWTCARSRLSKTPAAWRDCSARMDFHRPSRNGWSRCYWQQYSPSVPPHRGHDAAALSPCNEAHFYRFAFSRFSGPRLPTRPALCLPRPICRLPPSRSPYWRRYKESFWSCVAFRCIVGALGPACPSPSSCPTDRSRPPICLRSHPPPLPLSPPPCLVRQRLSPLSACVFLLPPLSIFSIRVFWTLPSPGSPRCQTVSAALRPQLPELPCRWGTLLTALDFVRTTRAPTPAQSASISRAHFSSDFVEKVGMGDDMACVLILRCADDGACHGDNALRAVHVALGWCHAGFCQLMLRFAQ